MTRYNCNFKLSSLHSWTTTNSQRKFQASETVWGKSSQFIYITKIDDHKSLHIQSYTQNSENVLCRTHFIEYLVKLIGRHKLDPVVILDLNEVQQELRRRGKPLPIRASGQTDADYTALCAQVRFANFWLAGIGTKTKIVLINIAVPKFYIGLLLTLNIQRFYI